MHVRIQNLNWSIIINATSIFKDPHGDTTENHKSGFYSLGISTRDDKLDLHSLY